MTDKTWKARERRVCRLFGGERRGADYADQDGGKNDCIGTKGWSIEIKNMARPSFAIICEDVRKAEARGNEFDIPIGIMFKKGMRDKDGIVSMRLETFLEWFGNVDNEKALVEFFGGKDDI